MRRNNRKTIAGSLILLVAIMLLAALSPAILVANAQTDVATVIMLPSVGGTTDPPAGTHEYANGSTFIFTATPDPGYAFLYWTVSGDYTPGHYSGQYSYVYDENGTLIQAIPRGSPTGIDSDTFTTNPANISHGFGYTYTYQAVFTLINAPTPSPPYTSPTSNDSAIVIIQPSVGGTTTPPAGTYAYPNETNFYLTATPDSTHIFMYWVVSGDYTPGHYSGQYSYIYDENGTLVQAIPKPETSGIDSLVFTNNPANISDGYGYTYAYTAVFAPKPAVTPSPPSPSPTTTLAPSPSSTETGGLSTTSWIIIIVAVVIIIIIVVAAVVIPRKK